MEFSDSKLKMELGIGSNWHITKSQKTRGDIKFWQNFLIPFKLQHKRYISLFKDIKCNLRLEQFHAPIYFWTKKRAKSDICCCDTIEKVNNPIRRIVDNNFNFSIFYVHLRHRPHAWISCVSIKIWKTKSETAYKTLTRGVKCIEFCTRLTLKLQDLQFVEEF